MEKPFHKTDVVIGATYVIRHAGELTHVRIDEEARTGWYATNLKTGRVIRIKSAAKLRRIVTLG